MMIMIRFVVLVMSLLLSACSSTSSAPQSLSPTAIIVRNNSGSDYASASLVAVIANNQAPRAYGELAPIPDRIEQVYGRPTRAAPLPALVEFRLQTSQGQTLSRVFQLDTLAQQAANLSAPYVLVFALMPGGVITPLIETAR
jgi:uncharacterized lipoprotein YmbA